MDETSDDLNSPTLEAPESKEGPSTTLLAAVSQAQRRRQQKFLPARVCDRHGCGRPFAPKRPHALFCSDRCRTMAWVGRNA
jgi:hypothetical protein